MLDVIENDEDDDNDKMEEPDVYNGDFEKELEDLISKVGSI